MSVIADLKETPGRYLIAVGGQVAHNRTILDKDLVAMNKYIMDRMEQLKVQVELCDAQQNTSQMERLLEMERHFGGMIDVDGGCDAIVGRSTPTTPP